jgi:NAD(P)-dependent dehydrogenase (short-subunit alcohol dehydrogenase family)
MKIDNSIAAVVTGGASGLGRASAQALADAGVKVAIFDISEEAGEAFAKEIGGVFCNVNIMDEASVEAGFAKARAVNGQERIVVHCAVVAGGGKTISFDKTTGGYKRTPTEQIARSAEGIFTASYRVASIAALGMATADPLE